MSVQHHTSKLTKYDDSSHTLKHASIRCNHGFKRRFKAGKEVNIS